VQEWVLHGWPEKTDVLNTHPLAALRKLLKRTM